MMPGPELRDIHLPPAPGWWPPAPGWWVLAVVVIALALWLSRAGYRRWRRGRFRNAVLARFQSLSQARSIAPGRRLAELSMLLRRAALHGNPGVAGLAGQAWLRYLDADDPRQPFSNGPGRVLADGPYRPDLEDQAVDDALPILHARLLGLLNEADDA